jgi:Rod binding domain-containing protein
MQSQRGTQRDMMTDMLSQHLAASEDLPIAEQLMKKWGAPGDAPETPAAPLREPVDPLPAAPSNPSPHLPSSHIDHAA